MRVFEGYQKGVNLGGWLSQYISYDDEHFNNFIVEEDIKQIASWGLDHVRLPIDYDVFETLEGEPIEKGLMHIDDCISWCRKYGLNLVLDLHRTVGFIFDTAVEPNPDLFFQDEKLQDRFIATWERLIKRYGCNKDMMAFELLNEVVNPDYYKKWNEIANRAIEKIREYEKDAYIIVGGVQHNNVANVPLLDPPHDEYIVYNFHCYDPLCFTHQHAHWVENIDYDLSYPAPMELYKEKSALLNQNHAVDIFDGKISAVGPELFDYMFTPAIEAAAKHNAPLYCGEYGVIDKAPTADSLRWLEDINKVFTKHGIGRSLWNYKQKDFGITDDHYKDIKDDMIRAMNL